MGQTKIIFRTPPGSATIPANTTINLTGKDGIVVKDYPAIRVLCGNRTASQSMVTVKIILKEDRELLGFLLNLPIPAGEDYTDVFQVPGTEFIITAEAGDGESYIDLIIYGYNPDAQTWCCEDTYCR